MVITFGCVDDSNRPGSRFPTLLSCHCVRNFRDLGRNRHHAEPGEHFGVDCQYRFRRRGTLGQPGRRTFGSGGRRVLRSEHVRTWTVERRITWEAGTWNFNRSELFLLFNGSSGQFPFVKTLDPPGWISFIRTIVHRTVIKG
jgi:hypothetical protein